MRHGLTQMERIKQIQHSQPMIRTVKSGTQLLFSWEYALQLALRQSILERYLLQYGFMERKSIFAFDYMGRTREYFSKEIQLSPL
ncbi:hypothetical protein FGO68_gene17598 [Halteria grandinella]|uniref:Uncharacterized protein n=1 Tax=Halteria grandinella TaxID=5974 RepID=A0A8J8SYA1_HALGN|nr:hypothetical protein FGO68_gene17598 [Halteria grandinella]